jgi:opine dehydrogenase
VNVAVLGAGNGGCALAADLALRGFAVTLFDLPEFEGALLPIREGGGLKLSGQRGEGFANLRRVTSDLEQALAGAKLALVVVPAFAHATFAARCAPHLRPSQIVVLNPGSTGGALEWSQILRRAGAGDGVIVAETLSLPYACRKTGPAEVNITGVKSNLPVAAFPASKTAALLDALDGVYPLGVAPAANVLETSLNSLNAIAHPIGTMLNAGWIEATGGDFEFYSQGITPAIARCMEAVDQERMAVAQAVGLEPVSLVEWDRRLYGLQGEGMYDLLHNSPVHRQSPAPASLEQRYLSEDVPYGLVPIASIGRALGVRTPAIDMFINLAGLLLQADLRAQGRTTEKLGLAGLNAQEILEVVNQGWPAETERQQEGQWQTS